MPNVAVAGSNCYHFGFLNANKMKTATDFLDKGNYNNTTDMMIEFAKMHAVEILKKLSKTEMEYQRNIQYLYPLSNIK